jgi:twitching motility two-component system response regulator PilH
VRKRTILVVDDDPTVTLYVSELLSVHGFTVVSAGDGEEGVARAAERSPDLILMDLNMPKVNGFEATKMLRRNARTEKIPIVALTALDSPADCESAFIAGCNDHLPKPLKGEDLLAKISFFLRLS